MNSAKSLWDKNYTDGVVSSWTANPIVASHVYNLITDGGNTFWLNWVFDSLLKRRAERILSVGCGDGAHELHMARAGYGAVIDAFDASLVGIQRAREKAAAEGLSCNFSVDTFESFSRRKSDQRYDFVLFAGSLHHVRDLEAMCSKVHELVTPDGHVCINEYTGPRHGMYPPHQIALVNAVLDAIGPEFKKAPEAHVSSPSVQQVKEHDPSEGIRSSLIPAYLDIFFEPIYTVKFGGALLHPLFDYLNSRRLEDGSPESLSIVRLLIEMDKALMSHPDFGSDFTFGLYKRKDIV